MKLEHHQVGPRVEGTHFECAGQGIVLQQILVDDDNIQGECGGGTSRKLSLLVGFDAAATAAAAPEATHNVAPHGNVRGALRRQALTQQAKRKEKQLSINWIAIRQIIHTCYIYIYLIWR